MPMAPSSGLLTLGSLSQGKPTGKPWAEWREDKKCLGGLMPEGRGSVPEGRFDRSLARSAWNGPTSKEPSRRVRYDRDADLIPEVFRGERCAVFFYGRLITPINRIGTHTGA